MKSLKVILLLLSITISDYISSNEVEEDFKDSTNILFWSSSQKEEYLIALDQIINTRNDILIFSLLIFFSEIFS
mgnify:CR=1 FL=1